MKNKENKNKSYKGVYISLIVFSAFAIANTCLLCYDVISIPKPKKRGGLFERINRRLSPEKPGFHPKDEKEREEKS